MSVRYSTVEHAPAQHQRLIAQLIARGFHASFRRWALGDTVFVGYREASTPGSAIRAFEKAAYLVPTADGLWQVDIGISDDAPVPEQDVVDRVTRLLCDDGEHEREFKRRARLLKPDGGPAVE